MFSIPEQVCNFHIYFKMMLIIHLDIGADEFIDILLANLIFMVDSMVSSLQCII